MFDADKTRMVKKTVTICWAVFMWYRNVTDRQTDGQRDRRTVVMSISRVGVRTRDKRGSTGTSCIRFIGSAA